MFHHDALPAIASYLAKTLVIDGVVIAVMTDEQLDYCFEKACKGLIEHELPGGVLADVITYVQGTRAPVDYDYD